MGSRDNHVIDDQRHDELLLRLLERSGQPSVVPPPADLVTRTLRRLPQELPAIAGQAAARRTRRRSALRVTLALTVALLAKPLLRTAGVAGGLWMLAGLLALAGIGWLWWRLLRRTPVVYAERV